MFFLHAPFPTAELLRSLSTRDALLEGLLANDVLGFHSFALARHFMEVGTPPLHNTHSMLCAPWSPMFRFVYEQGQGVLSAAELSFLY